MSLLETCYLIQRDINFAIVKKKNYANEIFRRIFELTNLIATCSLL